MQSEVLMLERRQLDLRAGTLRLEVGTTKNDDGRVVKLTAELRAQLAARADQGRGAEDRPDHPESLPVSERQAAPRRAPTRFQEGVGDGPPERRGPGMLRHDFRRTAVRNLVNAGVPERVAMTITGHKTRAVFDRYHIVSPGDLEEARGSSRRGRWA